MKVYQETATTDRSTKTRWLRWALACILLTALFAVAGPGEIVRVLKEIRPTWALATVVLSYVLVLLAGLNVWLLLRTLERVRAGVFFPIFLSGWAMSLVLPGQLGDASQVILLKRRGVRIARSGAAYFLDKGITLLFLLGVASYGTSIYIMEFSGYVLWLLPATVLSGFAVLLLIMDRVPPPRQGFPRRLYDSILEFRNNLLSYRKRWGLLLLNVCITIVKWVFLVACYLSAFLAFAETIPLKAAATIPVMSTLIGYIPVSVGGVGTVEWSAVYLFGREGLTGATVLTVYLFLRITQYLLAGLSVLMFRVRERQDRGA
jgi:uncharacterized protein (TIRG00374 family)